MKKTIYLLALTMGVAAAANAQRGTTLVYGNVGLATYNDENIEAKEVNFEINAGVGYQFDKNWTVGLTAGYGTDRNYNSVDRNWDYFNTTTVAPFLRYTKKLNNIFAVYGQAEIGYMGGKMGTTTVSSYDTYSGAYGSFIPSVQVFFHKTWALNFNVGGLAYSSIKANGADHPVKNFGLTFGRQASVGLSVNLPTSSKGGKFKKHRNAESEEDGYENWRKNRNSED